MPVKWTPENDQLLLLKILETHELSVDTKKVAAAWDATAKEKPTPRAITERLVRIRQSARERGGGNFSVSKKSSSATSTPRKPSQRTATTPGSSATKRKRGVQDEDEDDLTIDLNTPTKIPTSESVLAGSTLDLAGVDDDTPVKRSRSRPAPAPGMVSQYVVDSDEENEEDGDESGGSEYVPDDSLVEVKYEPNIEVV